jgi:hypothetical protein
VPILKVDHERKQVDAVAVGPISYADIENHLLTERLYGGLAYKELIDARSAEISFHPDETREIVALLLSLGRQSKLGPTAIVVSNDITFGILRMLAMLLADVAVIRPFRDEQEAHRWLASQK